jgi:Na+/proline symporter
VLIVPLTIQWWSVWYPGAEPGGGSYIAQRMLAAKSENDALAGTLLFNFAHYAIRPWPWIIVALASMLVYPQLSDISRAFPHIDPALVGHDIAYPAMLRFLPAGFLGLMVAGLLAAYVSTIATHLNWGGSYLVHDLYRRFIKPDAAERHYVLVGRLVTAGLMLLAALITYVLDTAQESFTLLMSIGAGTGLLYLLRWFWWRVTAWSEIAAMATSFVIALAFFIATKMGVGVPSHISLLIGVGLTTLVWIAVTFLGPQNDRATLESFYRLVRPAGPGWAQVRASTNLPASPDSLPMSMLAWILGCLLVYAALFGTGNFLYGRLAMGWMWAAIFILCAAAMARLLPKIWRTSEVPR